MKCSFCGKDLEFGDEVCPYCGATLSEMKEFDRGKEQEDQQDTTDIIVMSVVEILCCSWIFGVIALVLSVQARDAINRKEFELANSKIKSAKGVLIAGLIVGIITIVVALALNI